MNRNRSHNPLFLGEYFRQRSFVHGRGVGRNVKEAGDPASPSLVGDTRSEIGEESAEPANGRDGGGGSRSNKDFE